MYEARYSACKCRCPPARLSVGKHRWPRQRAFLPL
jgi:hypothetical protein